MEGRVPLTALRLVNPPGRKRRKPFPAYSRTGPKQSSRRNPVPQPSSRRKVLKRVKMGAGYRWSYGGKLIPEVKAKRIKAARSLTGTKPRTARATTPRRPNPPARRAPARARAIKKTAPRRRPAISIAAARANPPRKKKTSAATRKKISLSLKRHHRSTKRVSVPPKRRKAVARKTARRAAPRRRATTTGKPRVGTKAYYSWLGKKGAAARKRKSKGSSSKRRARRRVRPNPPAKRGKTYTRTVVRYAGGKKGKMNLRRSPRAKPTPHRLRRSTYKHNRTGVRHYRFGIIKKNPGLKDVGGLIKKVLPIYGGMIAARAISGLVNTHVVNKYLVGFDKLIKLENQKYGNIASPALTFLLSVFAGPSVLKGKTGGQILEGLQLGSLVATFDTILSAVAPATIKPYLGVQGYDDMGVQGYGMGAYMADPTGYSLPPAHASLEPGMGLDVNEAMALDSYVVDNGLGMSVEEALADSESDYMQRGGAGGSLSRTLFTY